MLQFELMKKNAGVTIWGDLWTLESLHDLIHNLNEASPLIENKEGFLLSFAYEVRKASDGMRKKSVRQKGGDECSIYGFEALWPSLIAQIGLLRASMAFVPTDKKQQSIMYSLEHIIESAVKAALPESHEKILYEMGRIGSARNHIENIIDGRCHYFLSLGPKARLVQLPMILTSLDPMYAFFAHIWQNNNVEGVIPASAFERYSTFAEA